MQQNKKQKPAQKNAKVKVVNQVKIDPTTPVPFEFGSASASYSVISGQPFIPFLPPKNDFANMLMEARLTGVTHGACIRTKRDYCTGAGFHDLQSRTLDKGIIDWFKSMNLENESAHKLVRKMFGTHFTFGNTPVELVRFTVAGKRKLYVYVHNLREWRLGKPDKDGFIRYAIHSPFFAHKGMLTSDELKASRRVNLYNPQRRQRDIWTKGEKGEERTLIWYKSEIEGFPFYGLPESVASMIFSLLEYKGGRFNLDNFDNNMVLGALLALKGNLSQNEANRIGKEIIKTHTGDGRRGRVAVVASEEGIDSSTFHQFDTQKDGSYTQADSNWTQKIILAHNWDAVLAGIVSPSTLGKGSGFLSKIIEHKMNTVIKPERMDLMEDVWNHVFSIAEEWMGLPFSSFEIDIKNHIDISGLTDVDITPAVQVNEVRRAKSLPEDPNMDGVYMKAAGGQPSQDLNQGGSDGQL